ncbi:hypothetical protein ACFSYH_00660 [Populibacterium corticicola]|uniref:DUF4190 domain-containing protein n=1 Tax=Populibacterium corticicola TaxID=1812826 RepID=A0ABW5XAV5_9MICO
MSEYQGHGDEEIKPPVVLPTRQRTQYILASLAVLTSGYGIYVAFIYNGVSWGMAPFAFLAAAGAAVAFWGASTSQQRRTGLGLLLQGLAPIGFLWVFAMTLALIGAALVYNDARIKYVSENINKPAPNPFM